MKAGSKYILGKSHRVAAGAVLAVVLCMLASLYVPRVRADVEPNDDFATAEAIAPGIHSGDLGGADANDFYKTDTTTTMQWVFANATIPLGLMANLHLYRQDQTELASDMGVSNGVARVDMVIDTAQTMYVQIELSSGTGTYSLQVAVITQHDASSGGDAGSDFVSALPIAAGTYNGNFLKNEDTRDFYMLTLTADGQTAYVNVTVPLAITVDLHLFRQDTTEVKSDMGVSNGVAKVDYTFSTAQNVYVLVELGAGSGHYDLQAEIWSQNDTGSGGDAGPDFVTATPIIPGTNGSNLLKDADSTDFYRLTLAADGDTAYVNVTVPLGMTINLNLFRQDTTVVGSDTGVTGGVARLDYTFATAQDVFVQVELSAGQGLYSLQRDVRTQNDTGSGGDAGNDFVNAHLITPATYGGNFLQDADSGDFYMVVLTAPATVYVNVTMQTSTMRVNLNLFDHNQNVVDQDATGGPGVKRVTYDFTTAQTIYIQVELTNDGGLYVLELSVPGIVFDTTPPTITHTAVTTATAGDSITITATITDNVGVQSATLYYRKHGDTAYTSVAMSASGSTYTATIPASAVTTAGVDYYISATDGTNAATAPAANPTTAPYQITVSEKAASEFPWIWIIVIIILLVVVIAVVMMMRKKPKAKQPEEGSQPPQ